VMMNVSTDKRGWNLWRDATTYALEPDEQRRMGKTATEQLCVKHFSVHYAGHSGAQPPDASTSVEKSLYRCELCFVVHDRVTCHLQNMFVQLILCYIWYV
jgi:hypothetical protein